MEEFKSILDGEVDDPKIQQAFGDKHFEWVIDYCLKQPKQTFQTNYCAGLAAYYLEQYHDALQFITAALAQENVSFQAHYLLGEIYNALKQWVDVGKCMQNVVRLEPHFAPAYYLGALACIRQRQPQEAGKMVIACLYQAHQGEFKQELLDWINAILFRFKPNTRLLIQFLETLIVAPAFQTPYLHMELGVHHHLISQMAQSIFHYQKAFQLSGNPWFLFVASLMMPRVYQSQAEIKLWRRSLQEKLNQLENILTPKMLLAFRSAKIHYLPSHFYLPYQGLNDQEINAQIMRILTKIQNVPQNNTLSTRQDTKIRIGLLSSFLREHSVTHFFLPFICKHSGG